jgi:hypothetical protein
MNDGTAIIDIFLSVIGGWRYLLSRHYRMQKHLEWRSEGWFGISMEILYGVFGIAVSLGFVAWAYTKLWAYYH